MTVPDVVVATGLAREFATGGQNIRAVDGDAVTRVGLADRVVTMQDGRLAGPA